MFVTLNNGEKIPKLGFGTWQLTDENTLLNALEYAFSIGYRHIDTAKIYENEYIIGKFLKNKPRNELFITSKLWNDSHENVVEACNKTLKDLQLDYLDLYLIHWPMNYKGDFNLEKVWRQMENLVKLKKVKSIGVCNFGIKRMEKLLKICEIKPAILQIEQHPYLPQIELIKFCKENKINVIGYSTLGSSKCNKKLVREDPIIIEIANNHDCKPSQVLLSWSMEKGCIVIPRSSSNSHIKDNFKIVNLTPGDIKKIDEIKYECRYVDMRPKYDLDVFE